MTCCWMKKSSVRGRCMQVECGGLYLAPFAGGKTSASVAYRLCNAKPGQQSVATLLKMKQTRYIEDALPLFQSQQETLQFCDFGARFGQKGPTSKEIEPFRRCNFCLANEQWSQRLRKLQARVGNRPVGALAMVSRAWRIRGATAIVKRRRVAMCHFCGRSSV